MKGAWTDGCMDGRVHGWMGAVTDGCTYGSTDGRMQLGGPGEGAHHKEVVGVICGALVGVGAVGGLAVAEAHPRWALQEQRGRHLAPPGQGQGHQSQSRSTAAWPAAICSQSPAIGGSQPSIEPTVCSPALAAACGKGSPGGGGRLGGAHV
jgi:hypothetical protein